ncbi:twin-arginine translocase TatA/TatE family subunit [Paenibacillus filicis]|uniref:Sec-independent protein translocase protein TatA n=1 Tax=Paenibacillus filicis TaxID=669464 RepID=A0ABU9DBY0_9BACL
MGALSPWHMILIAVVLLLLFGPNKLPELGRGFGKMFREFKDATNGNAAASAEEKRESIEAPKAELVSPSEPTAPSVNK